MEKRMNRDQVTIRRMESKDREKVFCMMRVFYDSPAVEHTSSDDVLRHDIEDCISDMPYVEGFVFEKSGQPGILLGYAMTARSYTTEYGGICIWLEDLYIEEAYRGIGLGSSFFHFMHEYYPEAVRFKLEVEPENEGAVATYQKNGYGISPYFEMTMEKVKG